jgi:hypothetical protein
MQLLTWLREAGRPGRTRGSNTPRRSGPLACHGLEFDLLRLSWQARAMTAQCDAHDPTLQPVAGCSLEHCLPAATASIGVVGGGGGGCMPMHKVMHPGCVVTRSVRFKRSSHALRRRRLAARTATFSQLACCGMKATTSSLAPHLKLPWLRGTPFSNVSTGGQTYSKQERKGSMLMNRQWVVHGHSFKRRNKLSVAVQRTLLLVPANKSISYINPGSDGRGKKRLDPSLSRRYLSPFQIRTTS